MSFPLAPPSGMRDLLPPEAAARAWLTGRLTRRFEAWGYERVTTPPFEHAEVIERGLETVDRRDLLRFVEPESGEVALLRPDITPQIARIVATRLSERPPPFRLCYAGSLIRQRRGRARKQRQIAQTGVELIGDASPDADAEVVALAAHALETVGLEDFRIELHLVGTIRDALREVPDAARPDAELALVRKDAADLARVLDASEVARATRRRLLGAIELYGDASVLREATRVFGPSARPALRGLAAVIERLEQRGLGSKLALDLGEVRDASYYTGVSFTLLAHGPGEPLGSGGRYDGLLGRFGAPAPATGFGLDLSNVEWALRMAGRTPVPPRPVRFVVAGASAAERERVTSALREAGLTAAGLGVRSLSRALDYARAWGYDAAVMCRRGDAQVQRTADGDARALDIGGLEGLARWASAVTEDGSEG